MTYLRYNKFITKSGIAIWYNDYHEKRKQPLLFLHAAVGGVSVQFPLLQYFNSNYNIIMPEIPGLSFTDPIDTPLYIHEIVNELNDFIRSVYINKYYIRSDDFKINLMGHSLGNSICCGLINMYPYLINDFYCIEGQIFFPQCLSTYKDFYTNVKNLSFYDYSTVLFLHRDIYAQYFLNKCLSFDLCFIYNLENERKHINVYMFHLTMDKKIKIEPQINYAKLKNIPITFELFDESLAHGSFVTSTNFRNKIINKINSIYNNKK